MTFFSTLDAAKREGFLPFDRVTLRGGDAVHRVVNDAFETPRGLKAYGLAFVLCVPGEACDCPTLLDEPAPLGWESVTA